MSHLHILDNNSVDSFQSAYRVGHSGEAALRRVYNYILTTVGKGNGFFLVLLDLSAAFDTIDHDNLFFIFETYVGISGSALQLILSYFYDRTQRVQIDGIMSDFCRFVVWSATWISSCTNEIVYVFASTWCDI